MLGAQKKSMAPPSGTILGYELGWIAHPHRYEDWQRNRLSRPGADLIVSCVDTRSARQAIHARLFNGGGQYRYWLDLGNTEVTAQVVLGQAPRQWGKRQAGQCPRLPCVTELFPELLDESVVEENAPSCSVRMSLASQGLFINDVAVRYAAQLLYELFSKGRIRQHGVLVNLDSKRSGPIDIDPSAWGRFGYRALDASADADAEDVAAALQAA